MERMTDVFTNWTQTFMEGNPKYQALINKATYNQQQLGILIGEAKCRKSRENLLVSDLFHYLILKRIRQGITQNFSLSL